MLVNATSHEINLTRVAYVVDLLVSNGAVVLEDVVVGGTSGIDKLLERRLQDV